MTMPRSRSMESIRARAGFSSESTAFDGSCAEDSFWGKAAAIISRQVSEVGFSRQKSERLPVVSNQSSVVSAGSPMRLAALRAVRLALPAEGLSEFCARLSLAHIKNKWASVSQRLTARKAAEPLLPSVTVQSGPQKQPVPGCAAIQTSPYRSLHQPQSPPSPRHRVRAGPGESG